jgi:putative PIN family toxin of toxin-antitoxin system
MTEADAAERHDSVGSVVLDTNILVSALLTDGLPTIIVDWIAEGGIWPCFDDRILAEYWDVLSRPKFGFPPLRVSRLIDAIARAGFGIEAPPFPDEVSMPDESDRKFYDIAKAAGAILITGNTRHYPNEPFILTPAAFVRKNYVSARIYMRKNRTRNKIESRPGGLIDDT